MVDVELLDLDEAVARDISWPDVYFTPSYGRAEELAGNGTWRCIVGGRGEWLLPFHTKGDELAQDAFSPYGYAGVYAAPHLGEPERREYWETALVTLRAVGITSLFLRQTPLFASPFAEPPGVAVVNAHETFAMSLRSGEEMWNSMEGRARTSIRKALREGFAASVGPVQPGDLVKGSAFRELYEGTMDRRSAGSRYYFPDSYYLGLSEALGERILLAEARDGEGKVAASALFFTFDDLMHYHLSGGTPDAGRAGATNLLIWAAAEAGVQRGVRRLHLGGGVSNGDGLAKFKRSFGGEVMNFDAFGVVVDEERYSSAVARRGLAPSEEPSSFFPAYRRP